MPPEYLELLTYDPPKLLELGFSFVASDGETWEGLINEFMQYADEEDMANSIVRVGPHQTLLPIAVDAGGNYLYLDLSTNPMRVIDVSFSLEAATIVALDFNAFLDLLYDLSEE